MRKFKDIKVTEKIFRSGIAVLVLAILFLVLTDESALAHSGRDYEINWYTIDGGGGRSTGGSYELTGTIGQHDAAWSRTGNYELLGGFLPGEQLCIVSFDFLCIFCQQWLTEGTNLLADFNGVRLQQE